MTRFGIYFEGKTFRVFADGVECERKGKVKTDSKVWGP